MAKLGTGQCQDEQRRSHMQVAIIQASSSIGFVKALQFQPEPVSGNVLAAITVVSRSRRGYSSSCPATAAGGVGAQCCLADGLGRV